MAAMKIRGEKNNMKWSFLPKNKGRKIEEKKIRKKKTEPYPKVNAFPLLPGVNVLDNYMWIYIYLLNNVFVMCCIDYIYYEFVSHIVV
jgi:hypothetical protein